MQKEFSIISKYRMQIMGFAALWIFIFHEWQYVFEGSNLIFELERFVQQAGFCGVDIFLLISGLGLTYSIKKTDTLHFYGKRLKRILFPFVLVAVFRAVVEKWTIGTFFGNVLGINFITKSIYSYLWFIPAIVILYLCFPLYYRFFEKSKNQILFIVGSIEFWFLLTMIFRDSQRIDMFLFTNRIPIFLIGVLIGWLLQNKSIEVNGTSLLFFFGTFAVGIYLARLVLLWGEEFLTIPNVFCVPNIFLATGLVFLLTLFFDWLANVKHGKKLANGVLSVLGFYGKMSLEFYCIQEWLAVVLNGFLPDGAAPLTVNVVRFVATTIAAYLIYLLENYFWKGVSAIGKRCKMAKA